MPAPLGDCVEVQVRSVREIPHLPRNSGAPGSVWHPCGSTYAQPEGNAIWAGGTQSWRRMNVRLLSVTKRLYSLARPGRSSAWLEHQHGVLGVEGSNPFALIRNRSASRKFREALSLFRLSDRCCTQYVAGDLADISRAGLGESWQVKKHAQ